ncbi:MAG: hypothetical protein ACRDSE_06575 [Pseudonocardiaceae bacterium]
MRRDRYIVHQLTRAAYVLVHASADTVRSPERQYLPGRSPTALA